MKNKFELSSAQDTDPLDPQDFGFLDPDPDQQKYGDPRIRIQGAKYQQNPAKKNLLSKPKSKLLKKKQDYKNFLISEKFNKFYHKNKRKK